MARQRELQETLESLDGQLENVKRSIKVMERVGQQPHVSFSSPPDGLKVSTLWQLTRSFALFLSLPLSLSIAISFCCAVPLHGQELENGESRKSKEISTMTKLLHDMAGSEMEKSQLVSLLSYFPQSCFSGMGPPDAFPGSPSLSVFVCTCARVYSRLSVCVCV